MLDPGHGGSDPGASGLGLLEKDVNLDVALRARDLLQREGATVLMTRTTDATVSLADRVALANANGAHRFLAIHSNACGGCGGTGTETYYHTSESSTSTSAALARSVQAELVQHLGLRDRGVKQADFYVLRNTAMPAILMELGFVDTAADNAVLKDPAKRQEAARAILHAVQAHFGITPHDPPSGDTTPPATSASLAGPQGSGGWWRGAVTVTLHASDAGGSGVASTTYRVDGGAWRAYAGPFAVGGEGGHQVDFRSQDGAGNAEAARSAAFRIDSVPPSTARTLAGAPGDGGWWRSAVTVTLHASDAGSGVASTAWDLDGGATRSYAGSFAVAGDGAHALGWASRDHAGNQEPRSAGGLRIDATPPSTALQVGAPRHPRAGGGWFVAAGTPLALVASDATSGVASTTWAWREAAGSGAAVSLAGPDGPGTLAWASRDVAGNAEAERSAELWLDTTPPALALDEPAEGAIVASLDPVRVAPRASDAGAGLARVEFRVDGALRHTAAAEPFAWDWPAGDEALGEHVLEVRAVDHLGHAASLVRNVTTVPTSPAGTLATATQGPSLSPEVPPLPAAPGAPPTLPIIELVLEADPATGAVRIGARVDGAFVGWEGRL